MFRTSLISSAVVLVAALAGCGSHRPTAALGTTAAHAQPAPHAPSPHHPTSGPQPATPAADADADAVHADDDDEPHASRIQVSSARSVARGFFTTYLEYLYGQLPAENVTGVDRDVRSQLEHGHAITTPAERASPPHTVRLSLSSSGPPISVTAIASVTTAQGQPSQLTATLEPHHGIWLVVAISG